MSVFRRKARAIAPVSETTLQWAEETEEQLLHRIDTQTFDPYMQT